MFNNIDSEEEIVLAKLGNLLSNYCSRAIHENREGENLLKCAGLSSLVPDYADYLDPYSFYRGYKNDNNGYNPSYAINGILSSISSNKAALGEFLSQFLKRLVIIDDDDICEFENYLEVLGYKLNIEEDYSRFNTFKYTLEHFTNGTLEREADVSYLEKMITQNNSELLTYYSDAISSYGNSEYSGCISNCRSLLESIFKGLDTENNDFPAGLLQATKETTPSGSPETPRLSMTGIFSFWIKNKKGFNRYRFIYTLYSLMSALGPHAEEVPTKEDALLCLRATEDILIWYYQNSNN